MRNTKRIRLRPVNSDDLELIFQLGQNPNVLKYINGGQLMSKEQAQADLSRIIEIQTPDYGYWIAELVDNQEFIGWFALKELERTGRIELGYRLLEDYWKLGYATEGARFLAKKGLFELGLEEIVAVVHPNNHNSIKVLEKIGMKYQYLGFYYNNDLAYYTMTKESFLDE